MTSCMHQVSYRGPLATFQIEHLGRFEVVVAIGAGNGVNLKPIFFQKISIEKMYAHQMNN